MQIIAVLLIVGNNYADEVLLVGVDSPCSYLVPGIDNGGSEMVAADWTGIEAPSNPQDWAIGKLGIGFAPDHDSYYRAFLRHDVREEMRGISASLWVRAEFNASEPELLQWKYLQLQMRFDDGFVAYLNGTEISRFNAPDSPSWDSLATAPHPDSAGSVPIQIDLKESLGLLNDGKNVLAVHLLNASYVSHDAVVLPELSASAQEFGSNRHPRHMEVLSLETGADSDRGRIIIGADRGRLYRLQSSADLNLWFNTGQEKFAETTTVDFLISLANGPLRYFRVAEF